MVQTRDEVQDFLDELTRELQAPARDQASHPVVEDIVAGRLSREQLKRWVAQQYLFSRTVPRLVCLRYGQVTDPEVQEHLMEVIAEEMEGRQTGTDSHVRLHARTALGLGMTLDELEATPPNPETRALIYWQELVIRARPWFIALGMKYGDEGQFANAATRLAPALQQHYGLSADDVVFYSAHVEADAEHGQFYADIIRKYVSTAALRAELRECVLTAADIWWDMWYAGAYREPKPR